MQFGYYQFYRTAEHRSEKKKKKKIWITQFNFQQKHCKKQKQNLSMKGGH